MAFSSVNLADTSNRTKPPAYGNGTYVVPLGGTSLAISTDGETWNTSYTLPASVSYDAPIAYGAGLFVLIPGSSNTYYTSPDGMTWTTRTSPMSSVTWTTLKFINNKFVMVGAGFSTLRHSDDGLTWTGQALPAALLWTDVTYGNGLYVVVSQDDYDYSAAIITSPDLATWTTRVTGEAASGSPTAFFDMGPVTVCYGGGVFVAMSRGTNIYMTSTDGETWVDRTAPSAVYGYRVEFGLGTFVAVGYLSTVALLSTDGVSWSTETLPDSAKWVQPVFGSDLVLTITHDWSPTYLSTLPIVAALHISGVVYGAGGVPAAMTIFVVRQSDGALAGTTMSDETTGEYSIEALDATPHYVVCLPASDSEQAKVFNGIIPV